MPDPVTGIVAGGTIIGGAVSSNAQKNAAQGAADAQIQMTKMSIAEQRRQFDRMQQIMAPWVKMGEQALTRQGAIAGASGPEAQRAIIDEIQKSPMFQSTIEQGENAILQNASATGGLRGGNVQQALAQFRPAMLSQQINQEYARLAGLTGMGQASAAGVGAGAMQTGVNVSNLFTQQGQAMAGSSLAGGQATVNLMDSINSGIGTIAARMPTGGF